MEDEHGFEVLDSEPMTPIIDAMCEVYDRPLALIIVHRDDDGPTVDSMTVQCLHCLAEQLIEYVVSLKKTDDTCGRVHREL